VATSSTKPAAKRTTATKRVAKAKPVNKPATSAAAVATTKPAAAPATEPAKPATSAAAVATTKPAAAPAKPAGVTAPATKPATTAAAVATTKPAAVTATEPAKAAVITAPATSAAATARTEPAKAAVITAPATKPAAVTARVEVTKTATEIAAPAHKSHAQLASSLQLAQQLCLDASQIWANAFSAPSLVDLSQIPGLPHMGDLRAATNFTYDVAADLLTAQREFTVQLAKVLLPTKRA
jgi:hypothetical protein